MNAIKIPGVTWKADVVPTADGDVERLTASIKGRSFQVNRHSRDNTFCTLMIDGRMEGRVPLDEIEFYIKVKMDLL